MVPAFVVAVTSHIMPLLHHRRTLFSVFLAVPRPLLLRLAATGEEGAGDGDGSGVQADDGGGRKQDAQLAWSKPEKSIELDVRTKRRVALLVAPMVILIGAILGLHMVSYFRVQSTRDPLNNMVATENLLTVTTRIRYWANQITTLRWKTDSMYAKQRMASRIDEAQWRWNSILQGNTTMQLTGSVMTDKRQVQVIQGKECLRLDKSLCRQPSDPYYDSVSNGLAILMGKYLTAASMWRNDFDNAPDDPVNYLTYNSPDMKFVYDLGNAEVADGLRMMNELQTTRIYNTLAGVVAIESALLAIAVIITALYLWLVRPMVRQAQDEVRRAAKLLSQLPPSMNVEAMLAEMLDIRSQDAEGQQLSLLVRAWRRLTELVGRCLMGRRFKLLLELEKAHLVQKATNDKAKRQAIEKDLMGS